MSARLRPASAMASSAALLMRSSADEPSCLPNAVRPTPVIKLISIRLRQAEHFLGDETQDQLRADRRDAGDQGFAQIALDVILLGVTKTAMGHHGLLAGLKAGFAREIFCGIRRRAAGQALVVF